MSAVFPGNKIKAVCESCLHAVFIVQKAFYNAYNERQKTQLHSLERLFFSSVLKYTLLNNDKSVNRIYKFPQVCPSFPIPLFNKIHLEF